jgi:hypothetical protein
VREMARCLREINAWARPEIGRLAIDFARHLVRLTVAEPLVRRRAEWGRGNPLSKRLVLAVAAALLSACSAAPAATPIIIYLTPSPAGSTPIVSATSPGTSTAAPTPSATHTVLTPTPGSAKTPAPTGTARQDVEVLESGFSLIDGDAQFATLLRNPNTATYIPTSIPVQISFFDASGPTKTEEDYVSLLTFGQTAAVTGTASDAAHPTRMEVRLGTIDWEEVDYTTGSFEISNIKTKAEEFGGYKTTGVITSHFENRHESVRLDAVYRDADAAILGGDFTFIDFIDPDQQLSFEITTFTDFKGIAATEVYWQVSD